MVYYTDQQRYAAKTYSPIGKSAAQYLSGKSVFKFESFRPEIQAQIIAATKNQAEVTRLQAISAASPYHEIRRRTAETQATSEAIKQQEQRAVAAAQSVAIGTIGKSQISTSVGSIVSSAPQTKAPTSSMLAPATTQPVSNLQGGLDYTVKLSDSLNASDILSQPNNQGGQVKIIKLQDSISTDEPVHIASERGDAYDILDPSAPTKYKAYVGSGIVEAEQTRKALPIGASAFVLGAETVPKVDANNIFSFPLEAKSSKKETKQSGDPLGIISASNFILEGAEKTAKESKARYEGNTSWFDFLNPNKSKTKGLIEGIEADVIKNLAGIAGFANIGAGIAARQKGEEYDKFDIDLGITKIEIPSVNRVKVPDTFPTVVIQNIIETKGANIPGSIIGSVKKYKEEYGDPGLIGAGLNIAADVFLLKGLSPIKLGEKLVIPLEGGASKTVRNLATYGGKEIVAGVGKTIARTSEKAVLKSGILENIDMPKMVQTFTEKAGRGAELEFFGKAGAKVFSSEKVLTKLVETNKIKPAGAELIKASKTIVQESKKVPNKTTFRDDYSAQPFENIPEKLTKTQLDFFREKGITIEGSAIDIPTFLPQYAGKAGDFDVKVKAFAVAQKIAKENEVRLNNAIKNLEIKGIQYSAEGGKLALYETRGTRPGIVYPKIKLGANEVLHGTSKKSQQDILSGGVDISSSKRGNAFFTTESVNLGKHFAKRASKTQGTSQALLKIKIEPSLVLKWKNIPKNIRNQLGFYERTGQSKQFQPVLINLAKQKGFKAVEKPYNIEGPNIKNEIIIFDEGAIKSVEQIPLGTIRIPILGKKIGKAGEYLSHDDPESLGQISKAGEVFGVKTPQNKIKVEGIKQKTLKFQLHRRGASVSSFKLENELVEVGPPTNKPGTGPTRAKDFPRFFAGAKTAAYLIEGKKNPLFKIRNANKAKKISEAADVIKRIGEPELGQSFEAFFKERRLTESYTQKPNELDELTRSINNIIKNPKSTYSSIQFGKNTRPSPTTKKENKDLQSLISKTLNQSTKSPYASLSKSTSFFDKSSPISVSSSPSKTNYGYRESKSPTSKSPSSRSPYGISIGKYSIGSPSSLIPGSPSSLIPGSPSSLIPGSPTGKPPKSPPSKSPTSQFKYPPINTTIPPIKIRIGILPKIKYEQRRARKVPVKKSDVLFIAGPADYFRVGVSASASGRYTTVPELRSRSPKVFKQIDKLLGKARKRKTATNPFTF